ncbi:MAG: choice-of-anchor E domain-containing protein [Puia sp.]|nr:choice-of-anchor E domain-containing protein [Puia sp.]
MKPVYSLMISLCISMAVLTSNACFAQCTCWTGLAATPITNTFTLPTTNVTSANLTFNQMDPSVGDLSCMTFNYNISGQTTTGVRNYASSTALLLPTDPLYSPTGRLKYIFSLGITPDIEGSGFSILNPFSKLYTDSLGAYGQPDDTTTFGPDMIFTNYSGSQTYGGDGSYLGLGTVNFSYSISGGLTTIKGGTNFSQKIITDYWGNFSLTYYYCPFKPLATGITNFTAVPGADGQSVNIQWTADNDVNNTLYEIQVSTDGNQFINVGQQQDHAATAGATTQYQYQYNFNQANVGKLYFRLQRTDPSGKISFSAILQVDLTKGSATGIDGGQVAYHTYPNPVKDRLVFQFTESQTGSFLLELVNTVGQVMQQKPVVLNGTSLINLDITGHPAPGLYYLRTRDLTHNKSYLSKILID